MTAPDTGLAALRDVARSLRARIDALEPTSLAWALLWHGDELHPWTPQSQARWDRLPQQPGDSDGPAAAEECWRLHHLAVLHHARAYDAENSTPPRRGEALQHWERALGHWARLHRCSTFWTALQQHLDEATGKQVPPEVLDGVRERLPDDLLAVHTALAAQCRVDDPPTAAAHMRLVMQSGFPADSVAAARRGLVADLDNTTATEIHRVRFGPAFDYIADWLTIDPANPWLLRNLLYVTDGWARFINRQPGWADQMAPLLERTEQILQTARGKQRDLPAMLASELAKYEFWRGFRVLCGLPSDHPAAPPDELRSRLRSAEVAVSHLRKAIDLDPSVRLEHYYEGETQLATALTVRAELKLLLGWDLRGVEQDLTEARGYKPDLAETLEVLARLRSIRRERGTDEDPPEDAPGEDAPDEGGDDGNGADRNRAIDLAPSDGLSAWDLTERGETYRVGNRLDEALDHFNRAIDLKPDYALAIARRGQTYHDMNRLDESLADHNRAIDLRPDNATFLARRGDVYRRMKRYDLALADYSRAVDLEPDTAWLIGGRGQIYRMMDRTDEALADFNRAIDLSPSYAWAISQRGTTYEGLNRLDEALADLTRAIDLDPNDAWYFFRRGTALRRLNRYEEALADLDHAIDSYSRATYPNPNFALTLAERGQTYRLLNRLNEALADLNRAIDLDPNYSWAIGQRGEAYRLLNRLSEALADFNRSIDLNPNNSWTLASRGQTCKAMNRLDDALADFTRAIDLDPNATWIVAERGQIYRFLNRFDEALADFTRALDLDPNYAWALARRGQAYHVMNRFDEALTDLTRAIDLDPNSPWIIAQRGETNRRLNRLDQALADLNHAIGLSDPSNVDQAWAIARRGQTYKAMNRLDDALTDFTSAIDLNPDAAWIVAERDETYRLLHRLT